MLFTTPVPVIIYRKFPEDDRDVEDVAWLCGEEWELGPQVYALQEWLSASGRAMQPAEYVADIGFKWRRDGGSGGPVLEPPAMRIAADIGMSIYFSEYAGFSDGLEDETERSDTK